MMRWFFVWTAVLSAQQIPVMPTMNIGPRIGVLGESKISLAEVVRRVLANDRDLAVSRIFQQEAEYNVSAAKGYYDPVLGLRTYHTRSISPVASSLGGAANGKLVSTEFNATPSLSGIFPNFGGNWELDFSDSRQTSNNSFLSLNPQYPSTVTLKLNQPLWRGLRYDDNRHRLQVAQKSVNLSREQLRQRVIEVVTQAEQAYWELDYAWRSLDVQNQAVRLAEQQFESNRRQAEQGLLAPIDVVAAQTQIATFRQNVFTAQDSLTRAENNLKQMIAANREDSIWGFALIPDTPVPEGTNPPTLATASARALQTRPELAQSDLSMEINKLDARLSAEAAKPRIDAFANLSATGLAGQQVIQTNNPLTGGFGPLIQRLNDLSARVNLPPLDLSFSGAVPPLFLGGNGTSLGNLAAGNFPNVQVGVQFALPLRNRTAEAQVAASAAEGRRLRALREQLEMLIEADVRNSLQSMVSSQSRLEASTLARQSAEQQYESEQRQFQSGTSTVFLVLQRQTDLISARTREVRAKADLAEALANLDRATANTLDVLNISLSK
jgi:outer membrane protein TolC